jgi:hypothetical protein
MLQDHLSAMSRDSRRRTREVLSFESRALSPPELIRCWIVLIESVFDKCIERPRMYLSKVICTFHFL